MKWTLTARSPFKLSTVVGSHGWIRLVPFSWDDQAGVLSHIHQLTTERVVELRVREVAGRLIAEADGGLTAEEQQEVSEKVAWMLGVEQDFSEFYELARQEPKLAQMESRSQGRLLRSPTLFEDTVKTILTTNTAWGGTIRMADSLVSQFGTPLQADPTRRAFPTPERLASADEESLRTAGRLGYRAPYVLELARLLASGDLELESLKTAHTRSTLELRQRLLSIKGVGEYAAATLLMLLGRYDFLPVDSWAYKVVSHEWYGGEPIGKAEVEAAFERWGEWKGLAYWFWDWAYPGTT